MKLYLRLFALLLSTPLITLFVYGWITLVQEHGPAEAPAVIAEHLPSIVIRSAVLLLPAAFLGIGGAQMLARNNRETGRRRHRRQ
jgi:hypothetical protein